MALKLGRFTRRFTLHQQAADTLAECRSYEGRPRRSALYWVIPALAISAMLGFSPVYYVGFGGLTLSVVGAAGAMCYLRLVILLIRGRTVADSDGLRNLTTIAWRELSWSQVDYLEVVPTPFGRRVAAVGSERLRLAAPREGLLAHDPEFDDALDSLASSSGSPLIVRLRSRWLSLLYPVLPLILVLVLVGIEKPWLEPWWPTRHEAEVLPNACSVVKQSTVNRLVTDATQPRIDEHNRDSLRWSICRWMRAGDVNSLSLSYALYFRGGDRSGTQKAVDELRSARSRGERITGLGDEAYRPSDSDLLNDVKIWARRANVVVEVRLTTAQAGKAASADAEMVALQALAAIRLN